ncbi:MAG: putative toxin-antitoxin system toxin component, PIN family [Chitinophagaceae bacterium]
MAKRKDRIILDTNLFISFLINNDFTKLNSLLNNRQVTILLSKELLDEFLEVSQRPKFRRYFTLTLIEKLLEGLYLRAEFVEVVSSIELCVDPKDNFLLALAKDGKASHLITGDKDLLELKKMSKTLILTIADYLKKY